MNFRDLLIMLHERYVESSFLVNDVGPKLNEMVVRWPDLFPGLIENPKLLTVKSLSNDMRRLYSMGFVKRKREKRPNAKSFLKREPENRGFQYRYTISSNGLNYVEHLQKTGYKLGIMKMSGLRDTENGGMVLNPGASLNDVRKRQGLEARFAQGRERERLLSLVDEQKQRMLQLENEVARLQTENLGLSASNKQWEARWKRSGIF